MIELTPQRLLERKAENFALKAHTTQKYGNHPYSYHLVQVVNNVRLRVSGDPLESTYVAVAWLHDVMEDCGVTYQELEREFGVCIADSVQRLTKTKDRSYEAYIDIILEAAIAREVKICDTVANLTESFKTGNAKGLSKYPKQLHILIEGCID